MTKAGTKRKNEEKRTSGERERKRMKEA